MTKEQARDRAGVTYAFGFLVGLFLRFAGAPRVVEIAVVAAWGALLLWFSGRWLVLAVRDGSLRRALPEYGWAFLGLLLIAAACAAATLLVLVILGDPFEVIDVSSGAAIGTFAVLGVWWLVRGRRQQARGHTGAG